MTAATRRIIGVVSSKRFFWVVFAFFIFESIWIALSAIYPQAFDENFHYGLIKIYSHHWLPLLSSQPAGANAFGAVARDPSYLYHYLMSFPYRLINLFIHGQTNQVIVLRFLNIGFFAGGLVLFRNLLLRAKLSRTLTNLCIMLFVLIPIVPQLAAHINYDNLLFPLIAWACLLSFNAIDEIRRRRPSVRTLIILASVCLLSSLVKYAFLPVFSAVVVFLAYTVYHTYRSQLKQFWLHLWQSWQKQSALARTILILVFVVSIGLFAQRDIINLVEYHSLNPNCSSVLSVKACSAYSPWDYAYTSHLQAASSKSTIRHFNPLFYLGVWAYWIWYRLFFAVNGPASSFTNYPPLPLPSAAAVLIALAGAVAVIKWRKRIFKGNPYMAFFFVVSFIYVLSLLLEGYSQYLYTDQLINMNGRYLLPVLLPLTAIAGQGFSVALKKSPSRKALIAVVAMFLFLEGGGVLTFISRSDPSWDWPSNAVVRVNDAARKITNPVIIRGKKTYATKVWVFN
jgi:hypothetical protein